MIVSAQIGRDWNILRTAALEPKGNKAPAQLI